MRLTRRNDTELPDLVSAEPDVAIFCDAGSHDKWWLASFVMTAGGRAIPVSVVDAGGDRLIDRSQVARRDGMHTGQTFLIDDELPTPDHQDAGGQVRSRWNLRCERCGDSLALRDDNLEPILQRLVAHNLTEVSLRGLRVAMGL